jgi:hypothetical protein
VSIAGKQLTIEDKRRRELIELIGRRALDKEVSEIIGNSYFITGNCLKHTEDGGLYMEDVRIRTSLGKFAITQR